MKLHLQVKTKNSQGHETKAAECRTWPVWLASGEKRYAEAKAKKFFEGVHFTRLPVVSHTLTAPHERAQQNKKYWCRTKMSDVHQCRRMTHLVAHVE